MVTGENGEDGPKAFYIHIEALPGREDEVVQMLREIFGCVLGEPATGPWFGVSYSKTAFGIFEAFPDVAGRDAHVAGGGGDIFRDIERMNRILAYPAHVYRVDVLLYKRIKNELRVSASRSRCRNLVGLNAMARTAGLVAYGDFRPGSGLGAGRV